MTGALIPGVLAAGGLTDINWTLFWATLVLFGIFAFVMSKLAWKPLLAMIEEREKGVRDSVEGAQRASAEAQALLAQHQELLREGGRQREEIITRASEGRSRLDVSIALQDKRFGDGGAYSGRRVSLRKERREGRLVFLVLVVALVAAVIWLMSHLRF